MMGWNHNTHYHPLLLQQLPAKRLRALDVGCGLGDFALKLAPYFETVEAIDKSEAMIERAASSKLQYPNVEFRVMDFLDDELLTNRYDFISGIAVIHHVPLEKALGRLTDLLNPGGQLAILGCYKAESIEDHAFSVMATPLNLMYSFFCGGYEAVVAPTSPSTQTVKDVVTYAAQAMPGTTIRRLLFWRYFLLYGKPELSTQLASQGVSYE